MEYFSSGKHDPVRGIGVILIVGGVSAITLKTSWENPDNLQRHELLIGLAIPFIGAFAFGIEPIFANFGFSTGTPAPVELAIKTVSASLGFMLYLRWRNSLPSLNVLWSVDMQWFVAAGIANTMFLLGYYFTLEMAPVNVVVPILIIQTLFVVLLSDVFLSDRLEHVTWRLTTAATVVIIGIVMITLSG